MALRMRIGQKSGLFFSRSIEVDKECIGGERHLSRVFIDGYWFLKKMTDYFQSRDGSCYVKYDLTTAWLFINFLAVVFVFWPHLEWTPSLTAEITQDQSWASDLTKGTGI